MANSNKAGLRGLFARLGSLSSRLGGGKEVGGEGEEPLDIGDRVLVIGDSHVRSYAGNPNFFPVFLGQGRLHNFASDACAEIYQSKADGVVSKVACEAVLLVLGEPDCRWALGRGWIPWDQAEVATSLEAGGLPSSSEECLETSVRRIVSAVSALSDRYPNRRFFVAPVFPVEMPEINPLVARLNECLLASLKATFLAVPEAMEGNSTCLADKVHQSNGIQPWIERELVARGLTLKSGFDSAVDWDGTAVRKRFVNHERFGCFVFEE